MRRNLLIQSIYTALVVTGSSYSLCLTINISSAMQKYFKSALHCVEVPGTNQNFSAKKCESWFMKYAGKMFPFIFLFLLLFLFFVVVAADRFFIFLLLLLLFCCCFFSFFTCSGSIVPDHHSDMLILMLILVKLGTSIQKQSPRSFLLK